MVELVKTPGLSTLDLSAPIPDNDKVVECMCYLYTLCVTLYIDAIKKLRKNVEMNVSRLEYISAQFSSLPPVCSCSPNEILSYVSCSRV